MKKFEQWSDNFPSLTAVQRSYAALGASNVHLSVQAAGLLMFGPGGGGNDFLFLVPTQLGGAAHRSQFARSVYVADGGTATYPTRPALAVLATGLNSSQNDVLEAYGLYILKEQGKARLARFSRWLNPSGVTLAEFDAPELGTELELRAGVRAVGADLEVLYDGNRAAFLVDESAGSLQHGIPAIGKAGSEPPVVSFEWGGFEAGVIEE